MKARILLIFCLLSGCHALSNKNQADRVDCGASVGEDYLYVLDSHKARVPAEDLQILVRSGRTQSLVQIKPTSKGCLSREALVDGDVILIKSPTRNEAETIRPELIHGRTALMMQSLQNAAKPKVICNHNVVDSTLMLNQFIDLNQAPFAEFYDISASISLDQALVDRTDARPLMGTGSYELKHLAPGRIYDLDVVIQDFVFSDGSRLSTPCELDMDIPNLSAKVGDALKEFRTYFGESYGVVDQGYELNFYIEGGLKSVEIDYCVARVNPEEPGTANPETACADLGLPLKSYVSTVKGERLDEGFWLVFYRYKKGLLTKPWSSQRVMVRKACDTSRVPLEDLDKNFCTDIYGNIQLTDEKPWKGDFELKYASSLLGQLHIWGTMIPAIRLPNLTFASKIILDSNWLLERIEMPQLKQVSIDLQITDNTFLQDLKGFSSLERVGNDLSVHSNDESLAGLEKLQVVGGRFSLRSSPQLASLRDLRSLTTVGGEFGVGSNSLLASFDGLDHLRSVGGLLIDNNPALESIAVTPMLEIKGGIFIHANAKLTSLTGFDDLRTVESISIWGNETLGSLRTFAGIHTIRGRLLLRESPLIRDFKDFANLRTSGRIQLVAMPGLESLAGLEKLERIEGALDIADNENLRSLEGLSSLVSLKDLYISRNARLESLAPTAALRDLGFISIASNPVLKDLALLRNLETAATLDVMSNEALPSLKDLQKLKSVQGGMEISDNPLIKDLNDLSSLEHVGGDLLFDGTPVPKPGT